MKLERDDDDFSFKLVLFPTTRVRIGAIKRRSGVLESHPVILTYHLQKDETALLILRWWDV